MKAAVFVVFASLVVTSTAVLLGSNRCTWGPSYWCTDLDHAKECSAMDHCINVFWKNLQPVATVRDTGVCQLCENIVTDIRQFLLSGKPQQQIEAYLENGCKILPDDYSRTTCDNVVEHYLAEAVQLINSTLDPRAVCQIFGLCQPTSSKQDLSQKPAGAVQPAAAAAATTRTTEQVIRKVMLQRGPQPVALKKLLKPAAAEVALKSVTTMIRSNPADCLACKLIAEKIIGSLGTNATEQQISAYVENNLCSRLGSLAQECDQLVQQYLPQLVQLFLSKATPDTVCAALGMCGALTTVGGRTVPRSTLLAEMKLASSRFRTLAAQQVNDNCDTCEEVINYVKIAINDNSTEESILSFLAGEVCPLFGSLQSECVSLVNQFGPELFALLINELDPAKICNLLGFCTNPAGTEMKTLSAGSARPSAVAVNSAECILCEYLVEKLEDLIGSNRSEAVIEKALGQVCSVLPSTVRGECNELVTKYGPALIEALVRAISTNAVCSTIGLCAADSSRHMYLGHSKRLSASDTLECDLCHKVVQYVESLLQANATQAAIISGLEKLCNKLPSFGSECSALVDQYLPQILQLLLASVSPDQVCQEIGLCQAPMKTAKMLPLY